MNINIQGVLGGKGIALELVFEVIRSLHCSMNVCAIRNGYASYSGFAFSNLKYSTYTFVIVDHLNHVYGLFMLEITYLIVSFIK